MRQSDVVTRTLRWTIASVAFVGVFAALGAAPALASTSGDPTTTPVPGLSASCPPGPPGAADSGIQTINGISFVGMSGECTLTQAHAAVGSSSFGANSILSATSDCTVNGTPTSSAVYNGMTITSTETIVTPDGYTLSFNVPVSVGGQAGRIAVVIKSPGGTTTNVAETVCTGAVYPLQVSQPQTLSPLPSASHKSGSSSALLLLGGALVAFVIVNVTGVRQYRRKHNRLAS